MENTRIWFTLSKDVYVSFNSPDQLLLYNTSNGQSLIVSDSKCIELIKKIYEPSNLGVIDLENIKFDKDISEFLVNSISLGIGIKSDKSINPKKPINLLPILNLQNDIEKLKLNGEDHLIGDQISDYLTSLSIFINTDCKQNCEYCGNYFKQTSFCTKSIEHHFIELETLEEIFLQSTSAQVCKINILGGDIKLYPQWDSLLVLFEKQPFDFHLWFNLVNLSNFEYIINIPFHKEILVNRFINKEHLQKLISLVEARNDFTFNFIVENEAMYNTILDTLKEHQQLKYEFKPFYNGSNIEFLKSNVYLDESDILSECIEMRIIFRNQKLNANFFGHLNFLPDGQVRASMNSQPIGYFPDKSILELIYEELTHNTNWRKIRNGSSCTTCMYRFICPPPGNLETVLGKQNLCHIQ
ncbi:MAG: TIGR04150 pseudo-rSAM protein [Bacteroidales bacterium]|nr:TIGR04150 pseudo-rSAM protein [Bacteroidales bacterium]